MKTVMVVAPEGVDAPGKEHEIPEADLQGFLANGWKLAGQAKEQVKKNKSA